LKIKKIKIGILGGTFDPAHRGHLTISKLAKKEFSLDYVIWAITKKNPFKSKSSLSLEKRIKIAKKITQSSKFIKIKFYEDTIKSNKTIDLINHIKKNISLEINFIMGADNLINFHKWHKWKTISQKCNILVFDRHGFKAKSEKSIAFKHINKKKLKFVNFKKVNISSSQLRKI
jgi:nicotinate-nucleotide adenylyltransferase